MRAQAKLMLVIALCSTLFACGRSDKAANTPAGRVGQVAYQAAKETGKAAKAAGHELSKAAHEAHEGWKEAAAKDKAKQQP